MNLTERLQLLSALQTHILAKPAGLEEAVQLAYQANPWFTPANSWQSLTAIAEAFLDAEKLAAWVARYPVADAQSETVVGVVMAGNIPLVGFHDWLCVFVAGHKCQVKLSEKDSLLFKYLYQFMLATQPALEGQTQIVERLKDFDRVIATGSDNTARYFEEYFGKYPHIIRKNRTSVAVLHGDEDEQVMDTLMQDVYSYFGLGCRNVSLIWVPRGYDLDRLIRPLNKYNALLSHNKWGNNYDYNFALYLLNRIPHLVTDGIILRESSEQVSRIATIHYSFYDQLEDVLQHLHEKAAQTQCVVSSKGLDGIDCVAPGLAQSPGLMDYADNVDTMAFLTMNDEQ